MIVISFINILNYSLGNLSYGVVLQIISSFLTFYGTSVLGISGTLMGAMVFISVVWDAVTDPLMGYISDNTKSRRFGKRHGYMLFGIIFLVISNGVLWGIRPEFDIRIKIGVLFTSLMLCETFTTVFATPYAALGAELSQDYEERTKIQATKSVFFLLGLAMPTVIGVYIFLRPTPEYPLGQLNPSAYLPMGMAVSVVALICAIPCIISTWKYRSYNLNEKRGKFSFISMFKDMISPMRSRESRYVILGYLWQNVSTAIVMTLNMHIFTYTFKLDSNSISLITATLLIASVISQPYWVKQTAKKDKKYAMLESLFIAVGGCLIFAVLVALRNYLAGIGWVFIPFALIVGFAMGGMVCIPQTMLIDTIDVDEYETGKRKEGSIFGCMTLFYKISQAVTIFLLGLYLDLIGFDASLGMQSEKVDALLGLSLPVGLLFSLFMTIWCFSKYSLNKQKLLEIQEKLKTKENQL